MFQKLILLSIFSLSSIVCARTPGNYSHLRSDLQKLSKKDMTELVNAFVKESSPSRLVGLPGHDKALQFITETIKKVDPKSTGKISVSTSTAQIDEIKNFYRQDFAEKVEGKIPKGHPDYARWSKFTSYMSGFADKKKAFPVQNVVWEKEGLNPNKILVVTAHYDTISHDKQNFQVKENESMPGANYNASGVAVALGLVKAMSQMDLNYTVRVVFLDWQGIGFHGSYLYAKELKNSGKEILGVVNLEMLGQDTTFFDKTKKKGNMSLYTRNQAEEVKWAAKLQEHGSKMTHKVDFESRPNGFENSDNFRFWEQGFLSVTFSQNWEEDFNPKFYQTSQDTPETLNHSTLWHSYQYIGGAVIGTLLDLTK